jgi:hypothetical protein
MHVQLDDAVPCPPPSLPSTTRSPPTERHLEPPGTAWSDQLNRIAVHVFESSGERDWRDLRRCWRDLRRIFGPTAALRLLNLAELVALVDVEEQP